jgi:hypothetical protein
LKGKQMPWTDQEHADETLIQARTTTAKGERVTFEVDRVGVVYRVIAGNLFGSQEVARSSILAEALRKFQAVLAKN